MATTATTRSEFAINEPLYQWCVRAFSLLRRRLGINIKVHGDETLLDRGQIFLFNHFARFETIIPQYFIHQATGSYCRCVATQELFGLGDRFSKFLWNLGAVPNNHPGLLAFLAAEVLRGRKVIIFPEGSMIKDRQIAVAPDLGLLPSDGPSSAHRQGAAALAVILDIFKKRILSVEESGDMPRLDRWVAALGLPGKSELLAAARKPTLVVPSNITFNPIHTGPNFLRRAAEYFSLDISDSAKDELLIESNLILRNTDMDIRLGQPFHPETTWNIADRMVLAQLFEQIDSLNELFSLKDSASRLLDRMAALTMRLTTKRLRDLCMAEMYTQVTVNLNHLASQLLLHLLRSGETEVPLVRFHSLLYRVVKEVQLLPQLHLHSSLTDPEAYDGIHDGTNPLLARFLEVVRAANLIAIAAGRIRLLDTLRNGVGKRDPRLENIVRVYANEVALLPELIEVVEKAEPVTGGHLAELLFDDELRAHARARRAFGKARHAAINKLETAAESGEPYLLIPSEPARTGVVLVHGFLSSPAELRKLGTRLADLGHPVLGVRMKGHGTSPWDLHGRSWQDWLASVRRGFEIMHHLTGNVLLAGFATGASVSLHLAASKPQGLSGVVAVSAPLQFRPGNLTFAPLVHSLNKLSEWVRFQEGIMPFRSREPQHPSIEYLHMPVRGLVELRKVADGLHNRLPEIACPVAVLHGTHDPIADPNSARIIHQTVGSAVKSLHMIPADRHGILHEDISGTLSLVVSQLQQWATPLVHASESTSKAPLTAKLKAAATRHMAPWLQRLRGSQAQQPEPIRPWVKSYPPNVAWNARIEPKPLTALLDESVKAYTTRTCMSFRGREYSYRELARLVDKAAKGFQELGVRRGIKVGLILPNCPYAVICYFAVLKAGGTLVNINPLYSHAEIARQAADSGVRIIVGLDVKPVYDKIAQLPEASGSVEKLVICRMKDALRFTEKIVYGFMKSADIADIAEDGSRIFFEKLIANDGAFRPVAIDPATDLAVLQYTGGTTGLPKGAGLTHANVYANAMQLALWAPDVPRGREKAVAALPLFHSFGMTAVMNLGLMLGAEMILLPRFSTAELLKVIDQEKPSIFIGVPTMFSALVEQREVAKFDLSSLKYCISGGAPLPLSLQRRFEDLTGCKLVEGYGLSEASPVCTVNPLSGGKPGSAGLPLPGTVIEIVDLENPDQVLPLGRRGEICVTGPQVMSGYSNRAAENVEAFRGARLHTGDVGYLDNDGYLFIVDRIKDLILSSGFNVYPRQVEEAIAAHPAIADAAVVGVPDAHRGETVKAYVQLKEGQALTAADLRSFLNTRLAAFELPRQIEFRETLPRTFLGKVSKKDLKAAETGNKQIESQIAP